MKELPTKYKMKFPFFAKNKTNEDTIFIVSVVIKSSYKSPISRRTGIEYLYYGYNISNNGIWYFHVDTIK